MFISDSVRSVADPVIETASSFGLALSNGIWLIRFVLKGSDGSSLTEKQDGESHRPAAKLIQQLFGSYSSLLSVLINRYARR